MADMTTIEMPPILLTGMSGAGLSSASKVLEDKGYYVSHNLPPFLISKVFKAGLDNDPQVKPMAVVTDTRSRVFPGSVKDTIKDLEAIGVKPSILFLDARDDVLIRRFDSVRRTHPLQGGDTLKIGIRRERDAMEEVRGAADVIIDTTALSVHDLRRAIEASFGSMSVSEQHVTVQSFGFKHGSPRDADLVVDVRFLPNPYWVPELRGFRGTDEPVSDYVLSQDAAEPFIENFLVMLDSMMDGYRHEGKNFITVGVGCTGGHHRSVAVSEEIVRRLNERGDLDVTVLHRDINRN
ncbi:RNase adapter RapZ [Corynebacterium sp. L4756]|uniref:RNase adapter RapZ n=1 Tax=unclassified Corynebacterium TaxID=2624378 RepID=UPI00374DA7F2